jgi:hypothetical protein
MSCHIDWFGGEILKCPYDDIQVQLKVNMVKWVYVSSISLLYSVYVMDHAYVLLSVILTFLFNCRLEIT